MLFSTINKKIMQSKISSKNAVELLEDIEDCLCVEFMEGDILANVRAEYIIPCGYDLGRNEIAIGLFTDHEGEVYNYTAILNLSKLTEDDIKDLVHHAYHQLFKLICGLRLVK